MQLIDTHAHLFSTKFSEDREEMLSRAAEVCEHVFLPNIDLDTIADMNALADAHPDFLHPMIGIHPSHVEKDYQRGTRRVEEELASGRRYYGIGETGIDLYWDKSTLPEQQASLRTHAAIAREANLPLILHAREAFDEVYEIVSEYQDGRLKGIFHCFTESTAHARKVQDVGFHIGLGGVLTFKNAGLKDEIAPLDHDFVVLETDAPYLAPHPNRGKRNETSYIQYVAEHLAEAWGLSYDEVAEITNANARQLFGV